MISVEEVVRHDAASGEPRHFKENVRGPDHHAYAHVLRACVDALDDAGIDYVLIGGLVSSHYGRPRWTHDIDVMVAPPDAEEALDQLEHRGFEVERTDPRWIYKALQREVMVDLIFRATGGVSLDAPMNRRAVSTTIAGVPVRLIPPEDMLVMKAAAHDEPSPRHWHDALGILAASTPLDWDYLITRASRAARRMLSLLIYAHSNDLLVPNRVISELYRSIYES